MSLLEMSISPSTTLMTLFPQRVLVLLLTVQCVFPTLVTHVKRLTLQESVNVYTKDLSLLRYWNILGFLPSL